MEEKARSKYWWVEDLVDSEAKAMGTYLALLHLLTHYRYLVMDFKILGIRPSIIINEKELMPWHALYLASREEDAIQAIEASRTFIDRLFENEDVLTPQVRNKVLSEIEVKFFGKYLKAFKRYLRLDKIPDELRGKVREVLLNVRSQFYGGLILTHSGTTELYENALKENIMTYQRLKEEDATSLLKCLSTSGLMLKYYFNYVFPAPCLSDEVIKLVAKSEKPAERPPVVEMKPFITPPPRPERFDVKPSKEILEGIVASVFEDLGFNVILNAMREARKGSPVEVDVWAWKKVAGTRFSVYVSCKNWNRMIDRQVINNEIGRVHNLRELPQLKVIIAKEANGPAKETAEADGFVIIELGKKAEAENAREIYELVYGILNELFTSIAPPRLREIALRIAEVRENLRKVEEELTSLLTR
jgi:hypothetical protein